MATLWPAGALRVHDVTKTVGAAGDFATLQGAIDWFKGKTITGDCKIDELDATSYDEGLDFSDICIAPGASLTLEGDTRVLANISYVDGAICNPAGLANGGTFSLGNECTLATNAGRDQITVSGGTVDPDFDAAGFGNGDEILAYADDGNTYERIINSISPGGVGNNVIEITVALPVGATLGNDATAILLKADRSIVRTAAGPCIDVDAVRGLYLDGWFLRGVAGADGYGLRLQNSGLVICENIATDVEDAGVIASDSYAAVLINDGASSFWAHTHACLRGAYATSVAAVNANYSVSVGVTNGFQCTNFSELSATSAIAVNANRGYTAVDYSFLYAHLACARQCAATGYYGLRGAYIRATSTNANNNGNLADYSPAVSDVFGNNNSFITWS